MKQLASIFILLLLAFVGASSTLHQLEEHEVEHCHIDGTHVCTPDAHHNCSLCDTLLSSGLTSTDACDEVDIEWLSENIISDISSVNSYVDRLSLGRAPPIGKMIPLC